MANDHSGGTLEVPVIDIAGWTRGGRVDRAAVAAAIDEAARTVGFMQVIGHGIPEAAATGLADAIDAFFALPMADKLALRAPSPEINRGYSPPRAEKVSLGLGVGTPEDLFEAFNVGAEAADYPDERLPAAHYPDNIWPDLPDFRAAVDTWRGYAGALTRQLTDVFAHALGLPEGHFRRFTGHSVDLLRMNHYMLPDAETTVDRDQMGMGAHTDFGIVTALWADPVPGLQILDGDGRWRDVLPMRGALLVNLGDALARWTNDQWMSTMHRVLPPTDEQGRLVRRRSAAYFHDGDYDAVISPLPGCVPEGAAPLYAPTTIGEHIAAKLAGSRGLTPNPSAEREAARLTRGEQ